MLQYLLQKPGMLSTTGYKVLQGQEGAGLVPCYRVIYDIADKLDYDVEQYQDLQSLLPELTPEYFLNYVKGILGIIINMRNIGFLHPYNLETTLDKIFIDRADNSVHMIYLPISESYLDYMNKQYEHALKASLAKAVQDNKALQTDDVRPVFTLLADASATLEQVASALSGLAPPPNQPASGPATGTLTQNRTGELATSGTLSSGNLTGGDLTRPVSENELSIDAQEPPPEDSSVKAKKDKKKKPPKKNPFSKKEKPEPSGELTQHAGGTEVLSLFIPSIYLKGSGKEEIFVDAQEFVLGRDTAVNGTIDSTAISRRHCKITHSDGRNFITDLKSANGTYLNGTQLEPEKPRPINEGDKLRLGNLGYTVMKV